ncbi:hypothetical protein [Propionispira raffinosivorans]|uniref:hypothetical protein n=1 Tax=Propionispira raffinosivorans TaxID=86959 RepID=UPI00035D4551|nr:hypothetical protein [Propionispira raffinosivorans]
MTKEMEKVPAETTFIIPETKRPFILGGHFGQGFNNVILADTTGAMTVSRYKRHFWFFNGKKEVYEYNVHDIESIEYKKKVHGRTKFLIAIGVLSMLFTGGLSGVYIVALLTCFHERNVTIYMKNGEVCNFRDIINFYEVNDMVENILRVKPEVIVSKNKN